MKKKHHNDQEATLSKSAEQPGTSTSRDIFLFGRLENEVALPVIKRMLKLNQRDPKKPINLYVNSSGGNGYNADGIIAIMHSIQAKVNTICLGHALSGACEILASGTGERSAYEFATLMFHQTLWEAEGDITNLEIQAVQGRRFREAQIELLHRSSGQTKDRIRKDIERDFYLSTKEALDYGLIDKIVKHTGNRHLGSASNGKAVKAAAALPVSRTSKKAATHRTKKK